MSEQTKPIKMDFSDKSMNVPKGKVSKLDPTEDSFTFPAPPPKGKYDLKLALSSKGIEARPIDPEQELSDDNIYFMANLECPIVNNSEWEGNKVFPMVSTRVGRNKNLSTMADLIIRIAGPKVIKEEMTDWEVAELFNKLLMKEPVVKGVECDWEGYSSEDKKTVFRSMDEFPTNGKGEHVHNPTYIASTRKTEVINAQLRVKKWPTGLKPGEGNTGGNEGKKDSKKKESKPLPKLPPPVLEEETTDDSPFGDLS